MKRAAHLLIFLLAVLPALALPFTFWFPQDVPGTPPPPAGPVPLASWRMEETLDTRVDATGNLWDLTESADIVSGTGKITNAASFDDGGSNGGHLVNNGMGASATDISVTFWFQAHDTALRGCSIAQVNGSYWSLQHNVFGAGDLYLEYNGVGAADFSALHDDNAWHFLALRITSPGVVSIRVDADAWITNDFASTYIAGVAPEFWAGKSISDQYLFPGALDAMQFFDAALSDADVEFIYNGGTGREYYSGGWTP